MHGGWRTTIASLKPIFSNALFHSSTPAVTDARKFNGMFLSNQNTMGCFGGDNGAAASCFSSRQRAMWCRRGLKVTSLL